MLEINQINKKFNNKKVLNNISFEVSKGRIFGIIGPNGAGKTTTLRIILRIITPTSGSIIFNDEEFDQNFQNNTGYLPEERGLYPKSNVFNTLIYLAQLKGLKYSDAEARTKQWLERLNLAEYEKYHIEELSKGNQQKVQFISAILHDPQILVLDEPFSGFDPVNQSIFRDIIKEMKEQKYIILSTHLMDLAESLCDDIIMIDNGKEILKGEMNKVLNTNRIKNYEILFKNKIEDDLLIKISEYKVVKISDFSLNIDLSGTNPDVFLRRFSPLYEITEFRRVETSLHSLFISLVENKE